MRRGVQFNRDTLAMSGTMRAREEVVDRALTKRERRSWSGRSEDTHTHTHIHICTDREREAIIVNSSDV